MAKNEAIAEMLEDLILQKFEFQAKFNLITIIHEKLLRLVSNETDFKKKHALYKQIDQSLLFSNTMIRRINALDNNIEYYENFK